MRVLVLGASGMAGHVTSLYLRKMGYDVDTLSATDKLDENTHLIDVTRRNSFEHFLNKMKYDSVVNCIGLLVKQSQARKELAVYLNSYLPHYLEQYYLDSNTKIIHLSTDGVYSSNKKCHYKEDSTYDADDFYGRTKSLGEIVNSKDLTFRMSIIGPEMRKHGTGLFNWFCRQSGEISGYDKVKWKGVTTIVLAKAIRLAIEQNLTGIYHLVPDTSITKFDLLSLFKRFFCREDIRIIPNSDVVSDRSLVNTRQDFDYTVPDYTDMIKHMKEWIYAHEDLYRHIKLKH